MAMADPIEQTGIGPDWEGELRKIDSQIAGLQAKIAAALNAIKPYISEKAHLEQIRHSIFSYLEFQKASSEAAHVGPRPLAGLTSYQRVLGDLLSKVDYTRTAQTTQAKQTSSSTGTVDVPSLALQPLAPTGITRKRSIASPRGVMLKALRQANVPLSPARLWEFAEAAGFTTKQKPEDAANFSMYGARKKYGDPIERLETGEWVWVGPKSG